MCKYQQQEQQQQEQSLAITAGMAFEMHKHPHILNEVNLYTFAFSNCDGKHGSASHSLCKRSLVSTEEDARVTGREAPRETRETRDLHSHPMLMVCIVDADSVHEETLQRSATDRERVNTRTSDALCHKRGTHALHTIKYEYAEASAREEGYHSFYCH